MAIVAYYYKSGTNVSVGIAGVVVVAVAVVVRITEIS